MKSGAQRAALYLSALFASITVASVLIALMGLAAWLTHSTAMLDSLTDTALNLAAGLTTLIGVHFAARPRDAEHRLATKKPMRSRRSLKSS